MRIVRKKLIKKFLAGIIALTLMIGPLLGPALISAEEIGINLPVASVEVSVPLTTSSPEPSSEPTPSSDPSLSPESTTPSPNPSSTPDPSASPSPSASPNPSASPIASPDPSASPIPSVEPSSSPAPSANTSSSIQQSNDSPSSNSGDNNPQSSASPSPENDQRDHSRPGESTGSGTVATGDSESIVTAETSVNSPIIDSQIVFKTLNIFLADNINLSDTATLNSIVDQALKNNNSTDVTVSVSYDGTNVAFVDNKIVAQADTGNNTVNSNGTALINTGDAYAIVSLLNRVNTTIIGSKIYLLTLNIFGEVSGNIILPEIAATEGTNNTSVQDVTINNQASLSGQIDAEANTGNNTAVVEGDGEITTGEAATAVNVVDMVNTTLIDTNFTYLVINTIGEWLGQFLGLDGLGNNTANTGGIGGDANIDNNAIVNNNILASANTGNNTLKAEDGSITTGNAYAIVSLFNFINSTIINSNGFMGFINIFGRLNGDIGGASKFVTADNNQPGTGGPTQQLTSNDNSSGDREMGGQLSLEQTNNVGDFVYPGDTVTFNINVKNTGSGRVDNVKLYLGLAKDGQDLGGGTLTIGNLNPNKSVKISTGVPLPKGLKAGTYTAYSQVVGLTGPGDTEVSAQAESQFDVASRGLLVNSEPVSDEPIDTQTIEVLGETTGLPTKKGVTFDDLLRLFWGGLSLLAGLKSIQYRDKLALNMSALFALIKSSS